MAAKKTTGTQKQAAFSKQKMLNLLGSLETLVSKLQLPPQSSTWSAYYEEAAQRDDYLTAKKTLVEQWVLADKNIRTAIDLGANDGEFSKLLARKQINIIAADADPFCINNLYSRIKKEVINGLHPLILDLANPSPAIGVYNGERTSFTERTSTDLALALALIHHLAIGTNIPFDKIAAFFAHIIEFVPKTDEKIQLMLAGREDIFSHYTAAAFEDAFSRYFDIEEQSPIAASGRILYRMKKHAD
jgi:ribosomal protein L11 methylase PrmA